ncbi:MAG TPA: hypothetical protein VF756_24395 [Thermoanaerobaculia bacterium]
MSMTAAALRKSLEKPIYNKVLHKEVGRGELDYEVYVRTRELLALQTPAEELVVPDELLFLARLRLRPPSCRGGPKLVGVGVSGSG